MMNQAPVRFLNLLPRGALRRGAFYGWILLIALVAFEIFNYSTTAFALNDLLGSDLRFLGVPWATILAVAFCGIDFAGIARLFTPQQDQGQVPETWYLFGAWLLAAAMNATLTWWGVAVAVRSHPELSSVVINQNTLFAVVPIFVALMVWSIRVLIIGTFSLAGERMFSVADDHPSMLSVALHAVPPLQNSRSAHLPSPSRPTPAPFRPMPKAEPNLRPAGLEAKPRPGADRSRR